VGKKRDNIKIDYLSRDFESIRQDLLEYARRYYPDTFKDFSDASFGALMVDTVAYIGDMLSFYLDYQANESFMATATEYTNVLKHGKALGYKHHGARTTHGLLTFYVLIPANSAATGPDKDYMPILQAGSQFSSVNGSVFTLVEDVNFAASTNEIVAANQDPSNGQTIRYAVKATGQVVSGETRRKRFKVGSFKKFLQLNIAGNNITEIISVTDSDGHQYFEVENLSQNIVYVPIVNTDTTTSVQTPNIIKPIVVPRRFIVNRERFNTTLVFGYGSDSEIPNASLAEPKDIVLDLHSRDYVTDAAMDPSVLIKTDKFGVAPSNTEISVVYRANTAENSNAAANTITKVHSALFEFSNRLNLSAAKISSVKASLESSNDAPIMGDVSAPNINELKQLIAGTYSAQNRAVTIEDYKALVLTMPGRFGGVKRCSVMRDIDSNVRNINIYVVSQTKNGRLETTSEILKQNIKTWLGSKRLINDAVDILDAKIINLGIRFEILTTQNANKTEIMNRALGRVRNYVNRTLDIGESFNITDIYSVLNSIAGIVDTSWVKIFHQSGTGYSNINFNIKNYMSPDGRTLRAPRNVIFEVKYPNADLQGTVR